MAGLWPDSRAVGLSENFHRENTRLDWSGGIARFVQNSKYTLYCRLYKSIGAGRPRACGCATAAAAFIGQADHSDLASSGPRGHRSANEG